jgi:hypothetical protein
VELETYFCAKATGHKSMVNFSILRKGLTRLLNYQKTQVASSSTIKSQKSTVWPIFQGHYFNPPSDMQSNEQHGNQYAYPPGNDLEAGDHFLPCDDSLNLLNAYLLSQENFHEEIVKLKKILEMDHIIFEIGCGSGEVAYEISLKNPHWGVIAIDKFDWATPIKAGSHYQKVAVAWREKQLKIQQYLLPDNLVVLRAEADILRFFPDHRIDSVLMLNPEPKVCEAFLKFISENSWYQKIKPGPNQILVVPFSREMGVNACGGFECAYTEERPGELSFLKAGHFQFRSGEKIHWELDLTRASAYSRNSALNDVYIYGNQFQTEPLSTWNKMIRKIF